MSRTIVIVGNGTMPAFAASAIDDGDLVIRFNDCRSYGSAGTRTDVVAVCNTGRPARAMIGGTAWKTHPAVRAAASLWCVRDGGKFRALRGKLAESHPDLGDFCDDLTAGFADFAAETGKAFSSIPRRYHDRLDADLSRFGAEGYVVPSSGLLTIAYVLGEIARPQDTVRLAGFDHRGWDGHPFDAEQRLVETLVCGGRLSRLSPPAQRLFSASARTLPGSRRQRRLP
ncbi:Urease operon accessory protein [Ectorhizobium quercum]